MSTDRIRVTDPAAITDTASSMLSLNVFQRLMTADPGQSVLKPDAARDCLFTSLTSYTCTLNKDLVFHNGHPLTSSDVKFSIERAARIKDVPGSSPLLLSSLRRIETPDAETIRFVLSRVDTQFGWALASPIASIVDEESYDADQIQPVKGPIVGSGPFKVVKFADDELQLSRYPDYIGRNAGRIPELIYRTAPDSATIEDAMTKGDCRRRLARSGRRRRHPVEPAGTTEPRETGRRRLHREGAHRHQGAATPVVAHLPDAAESRLASGDRCRPPGRPHLRFGGAGRRARAPADLPARREGEAEGHLEEPHQPHPGLRPVDAQWPGHRHPDPDPAGEHRWAERPVAAGRAEHRPDLGGPQGVDGHRSGLAAALPRRPAAGRRVDGALDPDRVPPGPPTTRRPIRCSVPCRSRPPST